MGIQQAEPLWSAEAIHRLRQLAKARIPADVISQAMHRPMTEIVAKAAELGVVLTPEERAV